MCVRLLIVHVCLRAQFSVLREVSAFLCVCVRVCIFVYACTCFCGVVCVFACA